MLEMVINNVEVGSEKHRVDSVSVCGLEQHLCKFLIKSIKDNLFAFNGNNYAGPYRNVGILIP